MAQAGSDNNNTYVHPNYYSSYDGSSQPGSSRNGGQISPIGGRNKRRQNGGDPPDDQDGKRPPPKSPAAITSDPGNHRPFACPYQVYHLRSDPPRCPTFKQLPALRQHINRKHRQPHHCPRCGLTFADSDQCTAHRSQQNCQDRHFSPLPGATQRHFRKRRSEDERWYEIWDILFPGSERPRSTRARSPVQYLIAMYRESGCLQAYANRVTAEELEGGNRAQVQRYLRDLFTGMVDDISDFAERGPRPPGSNTAQAFSHGDTPAEDDEEDEESEGEEGSRRTGN
ncbi:hypothetical protein SLS62_004877 [Diatrype stigma]|uniref:C2H2-type domain-containing protein n=1 Tax=Diatrype stigma TaxID=117547 RepID=A0AAN9UVT8_9PEZI